jgi:hypothetical protein
LLLIITPVIVHRVTSMWLEGEKSKFPDIDNAWKTGIKALKDQGLDLCDLPLFLVTGPADVTQARSLMTASERNFSINCVPESAAPLHWFVDANAIFLVLTGATRVAALSTLTPNITVTSGGAQQSAAKPAAGMFTATAMLPSGDDTSLPPDPTPATAPRPTMGYQMTLQAGGDMDDLGSPTGSVNRVAQIQKIAALPDQKGREIDARLLHVLHLITGARQPYCPVNGILSLLPFHLILSSDAQSVELQKSIRSDIDLLQTGLKLRCPVSVVVGGMESESGFRVLARRIGRDKVKASRFGKGNDSLWTPPTPENVEAIARHACGAFEDWVYHLFSTADGLTRTDNGKLYSILCLVRTELQERLTNLLCGAYGRDEDKEEDAMLFAGCYFAATGAEDDRQAFVKAVFEKLVEQEEQLSWTKPAVEENDRYLKLTRIGHTLNLGLIVALVVMLLAGPLGYKESLRRALPGTPEPSAAPAK